MALQVIAFVVDAFTGLYFFRRWYRLNPVSKSKLWRLFGWFSVLSFFGSICGAVAWGARTEALALYAGGEHAGSPQEQQVDIAAAFHLVAVFFALYPIEFLCLSAAKLMVSLVYAQSTGNNCIMSRWQAQRDFMP